MNRERMEDLDYKEMRVNRWENEKREMIIKWMGETEYREWKIEIRER